MPAAGEKFQRLLQIEWPRSDLVIKANIKNSFKILWPGKCPPQAKNFKEWPRRDLVIKANIKNSFEIDESWIGVSDFNGNRTVVRSGLLSETDCCPNLCSEKSGLLSEMDCCPNGLLSENSHASQLLLVVYNVYGSLSCAAWQRKGLYHEAHDKGRSRPRD